MSRLPSKDRSKPEHEEPDGLASGSEIGGGWVIGSLLALGLAAAIFAWLFQHYQTDESLAFWGGEAAGRIRLAEKVELFRLVPSEESQEQLSGNGMSIGVSSRRDISQAPGLSHARQALLQDVSYRFDQPPTDCRSLPTLALRFNAGEQSTTLLFDLKCPRVRHLETGSEARLGERLAEGLKKFLGEQLEEKKK